jgi:uncharacterized protein (TIGR02449 family)
VGEWHGGLKCHRQRGKIFFSDDRVRIMDNLYSQLEARMQALVEQCETLKQANASLNQIKSLLLEENTQLLLKHHSAVMKIEEMVLRLKSIELSL